jgi:hypothetical protein
VSTSQTTQTCANQDAREEEGYCEHKLAELVDGSFFLISVLPTQIQERRGYFFDHEKKMIRGAAPAAAFLSIILRQQ